MRKKESIILFLIQTFFVLQLYSQIRCGTDEYLSVLLNQYPALYDSIDNSSVSYSNYKSSGTIVLTDEIINVPVVVHIIHNGEDIGTGRNISDEQIYSQIKVLNEDFNTIKGNSGLGVKVLVKFCLAKQDVFGNATNGITRHYSSKEYFIPYDASNNLLDDSEIKSFDPYPYTKYLNLWVCDIRSYNLLATLYGYSSFPWTSGTNDGVVVNYNYFGDIGTGINDPNFNKGKTTTHEVGHWMGLWHTFKEGCSTTNNDCSIDGDQVCDTDPIIGAAWDDALINYNPLNCSSRKNCSQQVISAENYMDYNYDGCLSFFTEGQKDRMRFMLSQKRSYIYNASTSGIGIMPTECSPPASPVTTGGTTPLLRCEVEIDKGFFINGQFMSPLALCLNDGIIINFKDNDSCTFLEECYTLVPCDEATSSGLLTCSSLYQSLGYCDCYESMYHYWVSIYYNCDGNYDCTNEVGTWIHRYHYNGRPTTVDVEELFVTLANKVFEPGRFYKIKLAQDYNCSLEGGWVEGVKNIFISPVDYISFYNSSPVYPILSFTTIPNYTYIASNSIIIENSNVFSGSSVTMIAGNSITILPNTTISDNFVASIQNIPNCTPKSMAYNPTSSDSSFMSSSSSKVVWYNTKNGSKSNDNYELSKTQNIENTELLADSAIYFNYTFGSFPNPFHSITYITYTIMQPQPVTLTIKNILGEEVARLINNEIQDAACYKKEFDSALLKPGVYFYVLQTGSSVQTQKMVKISQ